jgi:hypothetical protein
MPLFSTVQAPRANSQATTRVHGGRVALGQRRCYVAAFAGLCLFLMLALVRLTSSRREHATTVASLQPPRDNEGARDESGWLQERMRMQLELASLRSQLKIASSPPASEALPPVASTPTVLPSFRTRPSPGGARDVAAAALSQHQEPWLVIGVPTVPRPGETARTEWPLLRRTLWSYLRQLAAMDSDVGCHVVVMNLRGAGTHDVFEAVKREFLTLRADSYYRVAARAFEFLDTSRTYPDDVNAEGVVGPDGTHEPPSPKVRRQSLDVVSLLDEVAKRPSRYFLFTEDDFELCPNGVLALQYAVSKARRYTVGSAVSAEDHRGGRPFAALRCGIGLNGIVMHNSAAYNDVAAFRSYLRRHYARRPPDHLVVEFYAQESDEARRYFAEGDSQGRRRRVAAFRHNIFRHMGGHHSTLRDEVAWSTPACFTELIAPQVFEVEAWSPHDCPHDDMWPCDSPEARGEQNAPGGGVVIRWNVSTASQVSKHWVEAGEG